MISGFTQEYRAQGIMRTIHASGPYLIPPEAIDLDMSGLDPSPQTSECPGGESLTKSTPRLLEPYFHGSNITSITS